MSDFFKKISWPNFFMWGVFAIISCLVGLVSYQLYDNIPKQIEEVKIDLKEVKDDLRADLIREIDKLDKDIKILNTDIKEMDKKNDRNFKDILLRLPRNEIASIDK